MTPTALLFADAQAQQAGGLGMFVPMLIIFALFYFMFIKPQQRKEKERRKMIENLRAGTRVVFAGGLLGRIDEVREKTFVVEVESGARLEVTRDAVQAAVEPEKQN